MSNTRNQVTEVIAKTIRGTSFVAVRNYTNSKGEISNQTFLVNADYGKAKEKDIEAVRNYDITPHISEQFDEAILLQAKESILNGLERPNKKKSDAQKDAYEHIGPGLKVHIATGNLHVFGFSIAKVIITPGVYPHVNSRQLTLAKKELHRGMNLRTSKYRTFILGKADELAIQGCII